MRGTLALLQRRNIPHKLSHKGRISYTFRDLRSESVSRCKLTSRQRAPDAAAPPARRAVVRAA